MRGEGVLEATEATLHKYKQSLIPMKGMFFRSTRVTTAHWLGGEEIM